MRNESVKCSTCGHITRVDNVGYMKFLIKCSHKGCECTICKAFLGVPSRNEAIKEYNKTRTK